MAAMKTDETPHAGRNTVVSFPLAGRSDLIRRSAIELDSKHGEEALLYWRAKCRALGAELLARGCSETDMRRQVMDFQAEVQAELMALHEPDRAARS